MASATPAVSIGNYKGVMLCNRPFVGMVGTSKGITASAKQAFVCGNVGDKPGTNVPISSKEKVLADQRPKKETALQRHRKCEGCVKGNSNLTISVGGSQSSRQPKNNWRSSTSRRKVDDPYLGGRSTSLVTNLSSPLPSQPLNIGCSNERESP